jgi:hypothetical protein
MVSLDIFRQDPFSTIQLTTAIEKVPYIPDGLEAMGIFEDKPIRTEYMMIEQRAGQLVLIPFTDRGAPGTERTTELRNARSFKVPRLRMEDTIYAREVAGIREFGQESVLMQVQSEVMRRLVGPTGIRANLRFTQEYHRLAALQGKLLDANGSVVYNWFNEFGITANTQVAFNLAANTARTIRPLAANVIRGMKRKAQGAWIEGRTSCVALCGDAFFDNFVTHTDVEKTYANWMAAVSLREGLAFESFRFADINWINYRGSDDTVQISAGFTNGSGAVTGLPAGLANGLNISGPGIPKGSTLTSYNSGAGTATLSGGNLFNGTTGTQNVNVGSVSLNGYTDNAPGGQAISIPSNGVIFFPKGAPGVFQRGLSPGDSAEWVNTLGKPEYARVIPDRDRNEWVKLEVDNFPLHICTRPEVLFTGTMDASAD